MVPKKSRPNGWGNSSQARATFCNSKLDEYLIKYHQVKWVCKIVNMAKEGTSVKKVDKNKEAFQMRAQWKKQDMCRKLWQERWSWLLDERKQAKAEADAAKREVADLLPRVGTKEETTKTLKPVPVTTTGTIGWLAAKPDCQLEIYTSWLTKIPLRLPDAWDKKDYVGPQKSEH